MDPHALPSGDETVLVVDDEERVRDSASRILERLGYDVLIADTPRKAIEMARQREVDLLLVDVILPVESGLTLAHTVSALRPRCAVLYMSGYTTDEVLQDTGPMATSVAFLPKPFSPDELANSVRGLLDRNRLREVPSEEREREEKARKEYEGETLLVIDDDADTRRALSLILGRKGFEVLEAADPDEALKTVLERDLDLIVMDIVLPRINGLALAHTISSLRPQSRILYVSGFTRDELEQEHGLEIEEIQFLRKPMTPDEINSAVEKLLRS